MKGAQYKRGIIIIFMEKEMKIINWNRIFCTPQHCISSYGSNLLVIGCRI